MILEAGNHLRAWNGKSDGGGTKLRAQSDSVKPQTIITMIALLVAVSSCTSTGEGDDIGETPTISMNGSLDSLQTYFNQHQGELRFVTLLSPT
jgi:hypothetical protein